MSWVILSLLVSPLLRFVAGVGSCNAGLDTEPESVIFVEGVWEGATVESSVGDGWD